jgi:TatD DNase family protein
VTLFDIAANLTNKAFRDDLPVVIDRAAAAGVVGIVIVGTSEATSERALRLTRELRGPVSLVATAGIHPHHASDATDEVLAAITATAKDGAVAIGECGLDYDRNFSPPDLQRRAFEAQLEIAASLSMPVYLHERDAHEDFVRILERWRSKLPRAVLHCFTGSGAELDRCLALDLHIGITGWICDERRGTHLRDLVKRIPRGRLMVETDAPYIVPRDLHPRPTRSEPAFVRHVAEAVARARGETMDDLAAHTTETTRIFFARRRAP